MAGIGPASQNAMAGVRQGALQDMQGQRLQQGLLNDRNWTQAGSDAPDDALNPQARALRSAIPQANRAALFALGPERGGQVLASMMTRENDPRRNLMQVGDTVARIGPDGNLTPVYTAPQRAPPLNPNSRYQSVPGVGLVDTWSLNGGAGGQGAARPPGASVSDPTVDVIIGAESGGNATARNPMSSATGLGQFTTDTWLDLWKQNGAQIAEQVGQPGLAALNPADPAQRAKILELRTNPDFARAFTGANVERLRPLMQQALGGDQVTMTDLRVGHFLGAGAGPQFAAAARRAPDTPVDRVLSPDALQANRSVFFNPDGTVKTVGQVYGAIDQDTRTRAARLQVQQATQRPQVPGLVVPASERDMVDYQLPDGSVARMPNDVGLRLGLSRPSSNGVSVSTNGQGGFNLQVGGQAQPGAAQPGQPTFGTSAATNTAIEERIVAGQERAARMDRIMSRFNPDFLTFGSRISNWARRSLSERASCWAVRPASSCRNSRGSGKPPSKTSTTRSRRCLARPSRPARPSGSCAFWATQTAIARPNSRRRWSKAASSCNLRMPV